MRRQYDHQSIATYRVWSRNSAALSGRAWFGPKTPRRGTWCRGGLDPFSWTPFSQRMFSWTPFSQRIRCPRKRVKPMGRLAWRQVDCDRRETRTCRALPYVLVAHPNDMENILVDMIANTNKLHSYPVILFCTLDIFNNFPLSGMNVIGDSARVGVTKAMTERTRTADEFRDTAPRCESLDGHHAD